MITESDASLIAKKYYGMTGQVSRLSGEYDANFLIKVEQGKAFLLKISRPNEVEDIVALQNEILQYIETKKPSFTVPRLQPTLTGELHAHHAITVETKCYVRLFTFLPEQLFANVSEQTPALWTSLGMQLGHLTASLTQFHHTAAERYLKWDLQQAYWIAEHLSLLDHAEEKSCVQFFMQRFTENTAAKLATLRHSVIHGDMNDYNILVSDDRRVSGFIDFGDVVKTATVCELAIALAYVMMDKSDPFAVAVSVIQGFHSIFPLQTAELEVLFDLICMRLCVSVVNSAMRKKENPDDAYLIISERPAWELLKKLRSTSPEKALSYFLKAVTNSPSMPTEIIQERRQQYLSPNLGLSYQQPLHIVRGSGQYLFDIHGEKFLDGVNNVAHVGHCHPRVVAAGQQQMAQLNTNTRYLHETIVRYAERLVATLPPELEVCFFVNSGSEANELALRLAETHTQRNEWLVMEHGYYGNTSGLINLSPYKFNGKGGKGKPDNVHVLPQPDRLRHRDEVTIPPISDKVAALLCEAMPSCGGQVVLPEKFLQRVYAAVRKVGGVCIADEIQTGLGRVGTHFWAFETQGVVPDIVTMGKPLGNGHPIGAVVTTRAIAESFCNGMEYFNTFGGNPVSCAIGLSVLDVMADEHLQSHALVSGNHLKKQLQGLMAKHEVIGDVRGSGLFLGVELVTNKNTLNPAPDLAKAVIDYMRKKHILLSIDGPSQNVIKIKPPLVFSKENGDELTAHLDAALRLSCLN